MLINTEKKIKKKTAVLLRHKFLRNQVCAMIAGWRNIAKKTKLLLKVMIVYSIERK